MKAYTPPPDKSITIRALLLGALAAGRTTVKNPLRSRDTAAALACLKELGVRTKTFKDRIEITGAGPGGFGPGPFRLDAGESGTLARLLAGLLAGSGARAVITGRGTLRRRPMEPVAAALRAADADIRASKGRLPLKPGPSRPRGGNLNFSTASAQIKSALLLAGLGARNPVSFREAAPSRDHTEKLMKFMGARLRRSGSRLTVLPGPLNGRAIKVPGDISSASPFIAAALLAGRPLKIKGAGLNPGRLGFVKVLKRMGARITLKTRISAPEPCGDITVRPSALRGVKVPARDIPSMIDELPLLALLAARARGATVIRGAGELRKKESDRIESTLALLASLGAKAAYRNGALAIPGGQVFKALNPAETFSDHRVAMAAAAASAVCPGLKIKNPGCVDKSYPGFFRDFRLYSVDTGLIFKRK